MFYYIFVLYVWIYSQIMLLIAKVSSSVILQTSRSSIDRVDWNKNYKKNRKAHVHAVFLKISLKNDLSIGKQKKIDLVILDFDLRRAPAQIKPCFNVCLT